MKIPFIDFQKMHEPVKEEIISGISEIIDDNSFILGPTVKKFEEQFSLFTGTKECVGVSSGCDAILLSLMAIGVSPGDEVITVANSYIGTVLPILKLGAIPVLVDCLDDTLNINPSLIEGVITENTKAIIPVHLFGQAADMDEILSIAEKYSLHVIEDAAQAHGATYKNKNCGSLGDIGAFSFYPGKNLGAMGDGGAVVTNHPKYANKVKCLRNYGQSKKYHHDFDGWNSRLDSFQAVALSAKLPLLLEWNQSRRLTAELYRARLAELPINIPTVRIHNQSVYHLFPIRTEHRNDLLRYLEKNEIQIGIHYPIPIHKQKVFDKFKFRSNEFPVAEKVADELLSLPIYPSMEISHVDYVCEKVKKFFL